MDDMKIQITKLDILMEIFKLRHVNIEINEFLFLQK